MSLYGRKPSKPFGLPGSPFDPRHGIHVPLADVGPFREVTILEIGHDALLCEDADGRDRVVLKPWALRKSSFNGETFTVAGTSTAYASTGLDTRTATPSGGDAVTETVTPPYVVGEKLLVCYKPGVGPAAGEPGVGTIGTSELSNVTAGDYRLEWEDLNTAGRHWAEPSSGATFATLTCAAPQSVSNAYGDVTFATEVDSNGVTVGTGGSAGTLTIVTAGLYRVWANVIGGITNGTLVSRKLIVAYSLAGAAVAAIGLGYNDYEATSGGDIQVFGEAWVNFTAGNVVGLQAYVNGGAGTITEGWWGLELVKEA